MQAVLGSLAALVVAVLPTVSAQAETDVFMRAVGFALTGSDDAAPEPVDRTKCVFAIGKKVYHLNNVHTDRIKFQSWERKTTWGVEQWVEVELHGDDVVVEETTEPLTDDGSELAQRMQQANPEIFKAQLKSYKERMLSLTTSDQDRVQRAWTYLYSHGCAGKQSPF